MIQCVAFDMDDTLYDEVDYYQSGLAAAAAVMAEDHNLDEKDAFNTIWGIFTGGNHKTAFNETLDKLSIPYDSEYIGKLVHVLRCHSPQIALPADSRTVLETLKHKYRLALITDGFLPAQKLKAHALEIEPYFDCMLFTEEWGREFWKPSPAAFEIMFDKMNLTPAQCVYVGDNPTKDFIAPNQLGMKTIRITRQHHLHTFPPPDAFAGAQYQIESIIELPTLLERIDV
jgi:putative hydrolase of the HAD superfamily